MATTPTPDRTQRLLEVYKGLMEVSALINAIVKSEELLPAILEVARRLFRVDAVSLFMVNASGDLELVNHSSGPDLKGSLPSDGAGVTVPRGRGISGWVLEHGEPLLIADAYADPRFYREIDQRTGFRSRSILCTPLLYKKKEIGVLQMLNPRDHTQFDEHDLEAFCAYGTLAATAIDKLRAIEQEIAQNRIDQEFAFAREIQTSFLPQKLPHLEHLQFGALYRPALHVGGDFYDVIEVGPDEIYFVIGDVSGKGMPAALLMAQALSILRHVLIPGITPAGALIRWNELLAGHTIHGMFITAMIGRIVSSRHEVEVCSAGHCHPVRISVEGSSSQAKVTGSPPLGLLPTLVPRSHLFTLAADEWLVFFTDGLIESSNLQKEFLETEGVTQLLASRFIHASDVIEALDRGEQHHRGEADPHDDLTLLVFGFQ